MVLTWLLIGASCASLPSAPHGSTCIVDVAHGGGDCVPIQKAVRRGEVNPSDADFFVPFAKMDNYVCFSPDTWKNIQIYIGDLKVIAQNHCQ